LLLIPVLQRLCRILAIAKVHGPCKILATAIRLPCLEQLLRPYLSQLHSQLLAYEILPAISPCQAEIGDLRMRTIDEVGNQSGGVRMRMCGHVQPALGLAELQGLVINKRRCE